MNLHYGVKPTLAALLSGALLSVVLSEPSCAGQDLRNLSFHPVRLNPASAEASSVAALSSSAGEYILHPTLPDPKMQEAEYREAIARVQRTEGELALPLGEQLLGLGHALQEQGRLDEALATYEASRHVMRVNLGLNSIEQAPVLIAMFGTYAAQGDVEN